MDFVALTNVLERNMAFEVKHPYGLIRTYYKKNNMYYITSETQSVIGSDHNKTDIEIVGKEEFYEQIKEELSNTNVFLRIKKQIKET